MTSAVERREHIRRYSVDRSESPIRARHSPRRRSSPRKERSPIHQRSPPRTRSSPRSGSSHRTRSPPKEKLPGRARSPKHVRQRSPIRASSSRSPSPRIKRVRRVQAEQEPQKTAGREHGRNPSREDRDKGRQREYKETEKTSPSRSLSPRSKRLMRAQTEKSERITERDHGKHASREDRDRGRHGERGEASDVPSERRSGRDKNDGGFSKSSRRDRSISPDDHNHRSKRASRSPPRASRAGARDEATRTRAADQTGDGELDSVAKMKAAEESLDAKSKDKQKPSFELSGKLAEETNRVRGVTLLFNEPPDARKPDVRWRLYVFKAGDVLNEPLYVHRQSCYLFGRERRVADIPTDHPSCSKQHAVIQYRLIEKEQPDGLLSKQVRPYLMDLGSTNGTFINDNRVEPQRYYELFEKDTIRFGNSSREYVILHENSNG